MFNYTSIPTLRNYKLKLSFSQLQVLANIYLVGNNIIESKRNELNLFKDTINDFYSINEWWASYISASKKIIDSYNRIAINGNKNKTITINLNYNEAYAYYRILINIGNTNDPYTDVLLTQLTVEIGQYLC